MFKQLLKNLNILNIILITITLIFVHFKLEPRLKNRATFNPKVTVEKTDESEPEEEEEPALVPQEYKLIAENNLFHPDRHIPKIVVQKPEEKLPPPDFILYGTMVTDDVKLAFIDDRKTPYTTPGGGKRSRTLKIGDTLSGYTLKEIDHEKAVMVRNGNEIVLKKAASQDKKIAPATAGGGHTRRPPQPFTRGGSQPAYTPQAPAALTPPTIITVPAVPVQPAAPKATTPAPTTPGSKTPAPRTPQQQQPQSHNKTNNQTMPPK